MAGNLPDNPQLIVIFMVRSKSLKPGIIDGFIGSTKSNYALHADHIGFKKIAAKKSSFLWAQVSFKGGTLRKHCRGATLRIV